MSEKEIEKNIIENLRYRKAYIQKVQSGTVFKNYTDKSGAQKVYKIKMADTGTPDTLACVPVRITKDMVGQIFGAFVAIEVKKNESEIEKWEKQKDKRSIAQHEQQDLIVRAGGVVVVAASYETVEKDLKSINFL